MVDGIPRTYNATRAAKIIFTGSADTALADTLATFDLVKSISNMLNITERLTS